jgi:hypothetical protein
MANNASPATRGLLVDSHVHLHDPARAMDDLRQAATAFAAAGGNEAPGVVMLAERSGYDVFQHLQSQLAHTWELNSLWYWQGNQRLLVVAGRQIVTAEGLEILGLATRLSLPDGLPAEQVLARLDDADAITVLPWGVGKWLGQRGKIVDSLLERARPGRLFLGDNGGRPNWWKVPQFSRGLPILAGSDPLPLPGSSNVIGRFGSVVDIQLSEHTPAARLKCALRDPATCISTYGRSTPSLRFIADQTRLRFLRKQLEPA